MNNKLQELTDKLYNEGLSKGQLEGFDITQKAQNKAEEILKEAQTKANQIVQDAQKQAEELRANADTEMKLAARQVISEVKQTIENMLTVKSIAPATKSALDDKLFIQALIKEISTKFNPLTEESVSISLALPEDRQAELLAFVNSQIVKDLNQEVEVKADRRIKAGFRIGPKQGGYYISFSNDDFDNLFKDYLRPKVTELLFGNSEAV